MKRSALGIVLPLLLLTACSGPTEPEGFTVEGFVTLIEDGSPIQGVSITAKRTWCKAVDEIFCRDVTETYDSAETDSRGYYRLTLPSGCVDIRLSKPGHIQSGQFPHVYCTPGSSATHPSAGSRVDLQMRLREPVLTIWGNVSSSVDGVGIAHVQVGVYREIDSEERIAFDYTHGPSYYIYLVPCEEVLYVQARCIEGIYWSHSCTGWGDSERVRVTSDCPAPGTPAVVHRVDFVLDPIPE
jgi:hypothetical protein